MSETNLPEPVAAAAAPKKQPAKKPRKKRDKKRRYGVPPMLDFDIASKPRGHLLHLIETASALRLTSQTVRSWTRKSDHPIKFWKVGGYWRTNVGYVVDYMRGKGKR